MCKTLLWVTNKGLEVFQKVMNDTKNQNPKGGTELQFDYLEKHVDKNLLDQVQICTSVPEKIPLHPKNQIYFGKKILTINQT